MGTNDGLDEHLRLCRQDVNNQISEVPEQAKRVLEALQSEREAGDQRIAELEAIVRSFRFKIRECPRCKTRLSLCEMHGLYVTTDENVCPACWRGE